MKVINQKVEIITGNNKKAYDLSELAYDLNVNYKAGEAGTCRGEIRFLAKDKRDFLVDSKDLLFVVKAGFDGMYGEVFKGVRTGGGVLNTSDATEKGISLNLISASKLLSTVSANSSGNMSVYNFAKRLCADNGYQLSVFEGNKNVTLAKNFSSLGNFYSILTSLATAVNCMVSFSGFEVRFLSFDKKAKSVIEVSSLTNSLFSTTSSYDEEKGMTYSVKTVLIYHIRVGDYIAIKTFDRETRKEIRRTMRTTEVTHRIARGSYFTSEIKGTYV